MALHSSNDGATDFGAQPQPGVGTGILIGAVTGLILGFVLLAEQETVDELFDMTQGEDDT
jgi:hypothetical protein